MAGFTFDAAAMAQGAEAVEEASAQIQALLGRLDQQVQAMFGGWSGDAQRSFAILHERWAEEQRTLNDALRSLHEALTATRTDQINLEQARADAARQISGQL